jgi:tRNA-Thr(GGU) m(6)t(6)A37 methyltransferase TsaA
MRLDINLLMVFASLFNWGSVKYEPIDRSSAFGDGMKKIELNPIGNVIKGRTELKDDDWDSVSSTIELDASRFSADALAGLDAFSHVEIVFYMDKVKPEKIVIGARHPRNNQDWPKLGIFAQRAKNRPNPIGTTICRLMSVRGLQIDVIGLDAVVGSPVLDIKPWIREFQPREELTQPEWISELMRNYWSQADPE